MDINELESFKMSDAIKFHDELNPNLWDNDKLDRQVRKQLLLIAEDFITTLGIKDLAVKDITVSGSNAAYTYTPHSDLDLHILVDFNELPNNEVYQELFNAKKIIYNDSHDITVHGVPVELYVQDTNLPVVSLGEYSVLNDKWIRIPKKQRANLDQEATRAKFDKLAELVDLALQTRDPARVSKTLDTIKRYRKAGLANGGEFSPENLAFKAIRKQGGIQDLYDLKNELHSEKLSIEEAASREDAILKIKKLRNLKGRTPNEVENVKRIVTNLMKQWNIHPEEIGIKQKVDPLQAKIAKAAYEKNTAANMFKQEWERFKKGIFAEEETVNELFNKPYDTQPKDDEKYPYDFHHEFTTDDGSKYVVTIFDPDVEPMIAFAQVKDGELIDYTTHTGDAFKIFATVGEVIKKFLNEYQPDTFSFAGVIDDPTRLKLYDRISQYIDKMLPDYKMFNKTDEIMFTNRKKGRLYQYYRTTQKTQEDYDPNGPPPGPEFKPTMPAGTVRVDVSDVYDWYKLGQHISNMKGLGKHDFGKGPPSTILSFGDEDTEHEYIQDLEKTGLSTTDIDPVDPNQPKGMKRQKTDPTYNVGEGQGGSDTSWSDGKEKITLQDILELTKHVKQINLPINDNLKSKLLQWDGNPEEIERINQVTVSNQFPILVMVDEQGQINWILDGNHRLHKAIQSKAKTIPAKLIKPSDLSDKARRVFRIEEQSATQNRKAAVLKIQKHLNKKYGANLDLDGKLGPLTLKSINKFMPRASKGLADEPNKTTAVQGKKLKEAPRTFQSQVTPLEKLIQDYGYFISTGTVHLEKNGETPEAQQKLLALVQRLQKDAKTFVGLDKTKMEANRDTILNHIHQMMQYAIPILKQYLPAKKWEAKRSQINSVLTAYNNARQINEASGYIPSEKEKNDPRFKTALTKDVRPDANKKNANAFGWKVSRAGIPPQARPDGKIK